MTLSAVHVSDAVAGEGGRRGREAHVAGEGGTEGGGEPGTRGAGEPVRPRRLSWGDGERGGCVGQWGEGGERVAH